LSACKWKSIGITADNADASKAKRLKCWWQVFILLLLTTLLTGNLLEDACHYSLLAHVLQERWEVAPNKLVPGDDPAAGARATAAGNADFLAGSYIPSHPASEPALAR